MGLAFDNSCAYWVLNECGERTSCAVYHHKSLSSNVFTACIVIKTFGTIAIILAGVLRRTPEELLMEPTDTSFDVPDNYIT